MKKSQTRVGDVRCDRIVMKIHPADSKSNRRRVEAFCLRCSHTSTLPIDSWNMGRRCPKCWMKSSVDMPSEDVFVKADEIDHARNHRVYYVCDWNNK